jgi:hypothetical protein
MPRTCAVPGCSESTSGYSTLCHQHKQAQRRHGSPTQLGVTSLELSPYVALVDARKAKNPNSEAWSILQGRWGVLVDAARSTLKRYDEGQVSPLAAVRASDHICNVADNVAPWEVISTAIAMFILQEQQPRRFTSDAAFDFQLVRRVLRLAPSNAGTYWDHKENRSRKVYRDVPPRVIKTLAVPLKEAFGAPGLMLAAREREDAQRIGDQRRRLAEALGDLQ